VRAFAPVFVRTERAGNSRQHHLRRAEINRVLPARNPDEILETSHLPIGCLAIEENALSPGLRKENPVLPRPFCEARMSWEVPRRRQRPGNLGADTTQSVGSSKRPFHERIIGKIPGVRMRRIDAAEGDEELTAL